MLFRTLTRSVDSEICWTMQILHGVLLLPGFTIDFVTGKHSTIKTKANMNNWILFQVTRHFLPIQKIVCIFMENAKCQ